MNAVRVVRTETESKNMKSDEQYELAKALVSTKCKKMNANVALSPDRNVVCYVPLVVVDTKTESEKTSTPDEVELDITVDIYRLEYNSVGGFVRDTFVRDDKLSGIPIDVDKIYEFDYDTGRVNMLSLPHVEVKTDPKNGPHIEWTDMFDKTHTTPINLADAQSRLQATSSRPKRDTRHRVDQTVETRPDNDTKRVSGDGVNTLPDPTIVDESTINRATNETQKKLVVDEVERVGNGRHNSTIECLDNERPIKVRDGTAAVCADTRCLQDPEYSEIILVNNRVALKGMLRVPALLKRCDPDTQRLVYVHSREPEYALTKEYTFATSGVYAEVILPSQLYTHVWNERTKRLRVETVRPVSVADLPLERMGVGKLRVSCDAYTRLLDFCRFSIHTHAAKPYAICCKRLCSRPEPLTVMELLAIRSVARTEPYYTCSWLEKEILFKWHVGKEEFEPYWSFDRAIGVYSDVYDRYDPGAFKLFAFTNWKSPDENVTNADEIYFKSPTNLAGYKWYEPSAVDEENYERYTLGDETSGGGIGGGVNVEGGTKDRSVDRASVRVAIEVMNLSDLPESTILSSTLIKPYTFDMGVEFRDYIML